MKLCLAQRRQASLRAVPRFEQSLIILLPSQTSNWHTSPQSSGPVVVDYTWKVFVTGSVWWGKLIQKVLWLFANALNVVPGIRIHSATKGTFHVIDGKDPSVCCSYHLFFVWWCFFVQREMAENSLQHIWSTFNPKRFRGLYHHDSGHANKKRNPQIS